MNAEVSAKFRILRVVVVGSWLIYAIGLALSIPIPPEAIVGFLLGIAAALVGISASAAALVNSRLWRILAVVAAWIFLIVYVVRFIALASMDAESSETSLLHGMATVVRGTWLIAQHLYGTYGIVNVVPYIFTTFAMPLLQLAIILLFRASPNRSLQGTPERRP